MKLLDFDGDDLGDGFMNRLLDGLEDHPLYYAVLREEAVRPDYWSWRLTALHFSFGNIIEDQISIHTRGRIERVDVR